MAKSLPLDEIGELWKERLGKNEDRQAAIDLSKMIDRMTKAAEKRREAKRERLKNQRPERIAGKAWPKIEDFDLEPGDRVFTRDGESILIGDANPSGGVCACCDVFRDSRKQKIIRVERDGKAIPPNDAHELFPSWSLRYLAHLL